MPVTGETKDDIVGIIHIKDVLANINSKKISEDFLKLEKRSIKFNKSFKTFRRFIKIVLKLHEYFLN